MDQKYKTDVFIDAVYKKYKHSVDSKLEGAGQMLWRISKVNYSLQNICPKQVGKYFKVFMRANKK